jgi:hypothetical protein
MAGWREGEEPVSPPSLPSVDLATRISSEEATRGGGAMPPVLDLASARGRRGSRDAHRRKPPEGEEQRPHGWGPGCWANQNGVW